MHLPNILASLRARVSRPLARRAHGQGLVEYSMILLMIAVVAIAGVTLLGRRNSTQYTDINCSVAQAMRDSASCTSAGGNNGGGNNGGGNNGGGNNGGGNNGGGNNGGNNGGGNNGGGNNGGNNGRGNNGG